MDFLHKTRFILRITDLFLLLSLCPIFFNVCLLNIYLILLNWMNFCLYNSMILERVLMCVWWCMKLNTNKSSSFIFSMSRSSELPHLNIIVGDSGIKKCSHFNFSVLFLTLCLFLSLICIQLPLLFHRSLVYYTLL